MSASDNLEAIAADVRVCPRCPLALTRTLAVPGEGPSDAEIFFIGEAPGFNEDQQGRPFVGAAGRLLNEMLAAIGLRREDVFISNVVRCRPPENRDPRPDELAACDIYTQRQLNVLKPRLVATLGRFSMARFFGPGSITRLHGTTVSWNGVTCLALFHPAYVLRDRSHKTLRLYEEDFRKIPSLLEAARSAAQEPVDGPGGSTETLGQLPLL